MYVKNSNFVIFIALAAIVGFGLSFLFSGLGAESGLSSGDISKAARYSNQKEDPALTVIEERLKNDEDFFNSTKEAMTFLQDRMSVLSELTDQTIAACEGIPEFESLMTEMKSLNAKSFNTAAALTTAGGGLDKLAEGKSAPEYELYSNQAYIGFGNVENQMDLGKRFYEAAASYLDGKEGDQYRLIADLAAVWSVYCTQDAFMNESESDVEYWDAMCANVAESSMLGASYGKMIMNNGGFGEAIKLSVGDKVLSNGNLDQYIKGVQTMVGNLGDMPSSTVRQNVGTIQLSNVINTVIKAFEQSSQNIKHTAPALIAAFPSMDLNHDIILRSNGVGSVVRNSDVVGAWEMKYR